MKHSANVMSRLVLSVVLVFVLSANLIEAAEIVVSVATDKPAYLVGEDITVSVTAYNPNDYEETLWFSSSLQASYIMDDVYDWSSDLVFTQALTEVTIGAESSYTWDLEHDWEYTVGDYPDTYGYDLSPGTHSVVGALQANGPPGNYTYYSQAAEFEVAEIVVCMPGDVDGDGWVSDTDLSIVIANWGQSGLGRAGGDLNGNGIVDGRDYSEVLSYWNPPPEPPGEPTPEPATLGLMVVGGLAMLIRKRK